MKPLIKEKLEELIDLSSEQRLTEVIWKEKEFKISFRRGFSRQSPVSAVADVPSGENSSNEPQDVLVLSPIVGTFRRSISKTRPPLVMEGDHVKPGDRLGIVECMKIPTDVPSISLGQISKIFVNDGNVVEYGQPLFAIRPSSGNNDTANTGG